MKKEEKTQLTVSKILDAATAEFGGKGYRNGTINTVCRAGINKGLVYHNFKNKDDLYLACLQRSCGKLVVFIRENACTESFPKYMRARADFLRNYPDEAHLVFEALLDPPEHLLPEIREMLQELEKINETVYKNTLSAVTLRDGVTTEDALKYFQQMQRLFNSCFNSDNYRTMTFDEKIKGHEERIPKLLDFMLYGIAKGDTCQW